MRPRAKHLRQERVLSVRVSPALEAKVQGIADAEGRSVSNMLRRIVEQWAAER
jgi:predicted transcriptional regulator